MAGTGHTEGLEAILQRLQTLENLVVSLQATVAKQEKIIAELTEIIAQKDAVIRKYQSMLFDKKSEKDHGRAIKTDDTAAPLEPETDVLLSPLTEKPKRGQRPGTPGHGRRLYEELPPREVLYDLPAEACRCDKCGEKFVPCGTEDSNTVEWEVNIRKVIHRRAKYRRACSCHRPIVITAPAPAKLFPKALMEISTVANLIVNKFLHGQPINRQLNELELHSGVRFAAGTIVGVQAKVADLLRPLYDEYIIHLREAEHWHADETRWMQYADETKQRWWMWVFAAKDVVAFVLDPTRSRKVPLKLFGLDDPNAYHARGNLSCDRWRAYQGIDGIRTAFCWAHVRRDFIDVDKKYPNKVVEWTNSWIARIAELYHLHDERKLCEPGTEEFRTADEALRNHVAEIERARDMEAADANLLLAARKKLKSMSRHWEGLTLFLDHLEVPLDNNEAERLLRTGVVGRKNFYGSSSYKSGDLTESSYTILLTADKNELNPLTYLRAYLDACAKNAGNPPADLTRFLPWKASKEDLAAWKLAPSSN